MFAITAGRTSFLNFENDIKILFSEWPIGIWLRKTGKSETNPRCQPINILAQKQQGTTDIMD